MWVIKCCLTGRTGSGTFSCVAETEGGKTAENATILITESVTYLDKVTQHSSPDINLQQGRVPVQIHKNKHVYVFMPKIFSLLLNQKALVCTDRMTDKAIILRDDIRIKNCMSRRFAKIDILLTQRPDVSEI